MASTTVEYTIHLTAEEHAELVRLLEEASREMHLEARRTESPKYQESVHAQEAKLRALSKKFREAAANA